MAVGSLCKKILPFKSKFSKFKAHLPFFKRAVSVWSKIPDEPQGILLNFQQNLQQHNLAVAGKQLICREEHLFAMKQEGVGNNNSSMKEEREDEEEKLIKDFEDLLQTVMATVETSFDVQTNEEKVLLKEAVLAIDQEEKQDRRWEGVEENKRPPWRPRCCRQAHDRLLQNLVMQRMEEAKLDSNVNIKSSVQLEITAWGKQLKQDLLKITKNVKNCYPEENVCQLYAKIYHLVLSNKLREITDCGLDDKDCIYVLQWVNILYPEILRHEELSRVIEYEHLEALLPDDILEQLVERFLIKKENELKTWCEKVIKCERKSNPELQDNCYTSYLAIDVTQCVNAILTSTKNVLGSWSKIHRITHQLKQFLINYQHFLEKVINDNQANIDAVLKANLYCIRDIREYIMKTPDLLPQHINVDCIELLNRMRDTCHSYFTKVIHKNLKETYSKLGTKEWFKNNECACNNLLEGVQRQIQDFSNLHEECLKEFVSKLHEEVLAKYVKKMMKKKIRFKHEKKQQQAAAALCSNSQKIHTLFTEAGSNMKGLEEILPKLAELLTLNDLHSIKLQLALLSKIYPDFSKAHVSAWLYLKANLSSSDLKQIMKTFSHTQITECTVDDQDPLYSSRNFFSKVVIK